MQNALILYEQSAEETLTEQFARIFQTSTGVQCIAEKSKMMKGEMVQDWTHCLEDSIFTRKNQGEIFFTPHSFKKKERSELQVCELTSFYVDLDFNYAKKYDKLTNFNRFNELPIEYQLNWLRIAVSDAEMPEPTAIVRTGGGYHLYWRIESIVSNSEVIRATWSKTEQEIVKRLTYYGADPGAADIARVLRLPETKNWKYMTRPKVEVIYVNERNLYTMREIREILFPNSKPYVKYENQKKAERKSKKQAAKIYLMNNAYNLNKTRMADLYRLIELRGNNPQGQRARIMYFAALVHAHADFETDVEDVLWEINDMFNDPLPQGQMKAHIKYARKPELKERMRTNDFFIKWLQITEDEQRELKTIISKKEKRRRQAVKKRKQYEPTMKRNQTAKERRDERVLALRSEGYTHKEIARKTGISISTITRIIRKDK